MTVRCGRRLRLATAALIGALGLACAGAWAEGTCEVIELANAREVRTGQALPGPGSSHRRGVHGDRHGDATGGPLRIAIGHGQVGRAAL